MVPPISAEKLDLAISLTSEDSPPVVFLLVHPSLSVKGASGESGVHQGDVGGESHVSKYIGRGMVGSPRPMNALDPLDARELGS